MRGEWGILRADMVRYLVLLVHGGVYADSDTACVAPFDQWLSPETKARMVDSVKTLIPPTAICIRMTIMNGQADAVGLSRNASLQPRFAAGAGRRREPTACFLAPPPASLIPSQP